MRREAAFTLPAHYVVTLRVRGQAAPCELQVKLVDPSGANVWWWRRRDFAPRPDAERIVLRRASLAFAWGPRSGGDPDRIGAVELAVASDAGASGALWLEALRVEPRPPAEGPPRPCAVRASSRAPGHEPERVLEDDPESGWRPAAGDAHPWIEADLGALREWGGLAVDWSGPAPASRVLASEDGQRYTPLADDPGGARGRSWLRTGAADARFVRLEVAPGGGGITRLEVVPIELAVSPARWAASVARAARRGSHPRHLLGEQAYWALVGGDGDARKGLLSEDGALEVDAEAWSVEPFLWADGGLLTWADVAASQSLADDCLPIPSVEWAAGELRLRITAFASGAPGESALVACYHVANAGPAARDVRLFLAIRPFQVTPAWQSLNLVGGIAPVTALAREVGGARIRVDGGREVVAVSVSDAFGAARSEEGLRSLFEGRVPAAERADDPLGFAEGALAFDLRLAAGGSESIVVSVPLFDAAPPAPAALPRAEAARWGEARLAEAIARWRARLACVPISLPASAARFEASLRASLAWILVNREGPRIQPGPRCYRRSWIRDGTLTGMALVEMGFAEEARAFLRWYAPYQYPDGRVPCAVDRHGVDPVPEHDSHGQLAWGIAEAFRLTGDVAFLRELWPHARRAAGAIASLRAQRLGEVWRERGCQGLLPESISHEGYSSNPVHSYWDDFFAVLGLASAARAAEALGEVDAQREIGALHDALRRDLHASIEQAIRRHGIDFVPGSVELGDFDPTSTAIALDPCEEGGRLPAAALARTFERYWEEFEARRRGEAGNDAYTAYEIRNAVALLRLGWKERALGLLEWLVADQRLPAWCQWPEVSTRDPRAARFLGDLPHGWIASSFVRTLRRLLAYEDGEAGALVVAAGVPEAWVREAPGVRVRGLATHFGPLDLDLVAEGEDVVCARFGGACRPPGGLVLVSPLARPLRRVVADGRVLPVAAPDRIALPEAPGVVLLHHERRP